MIVAAEAGDLRHDYRLMSMSSCQAPIARITASMLSPMVASI